MILMFSFPFVVFSSSENNNKSAQKRNGNWTAREDASRALSFLLFSVCRAKKKSSNNYIYLKRALETLSNSLSLSLSLFSSERKGSLFTRAKSIEIGIRIGANCEVLKEKNPKRDVAYYHPAAREDMICALCVIALDITVYK